MKSTIGEILMSNNNYGFFKTYYTVMTDKQKRSLYQEYTMNFVNDFNDGILMSYNDFLIKKIFLKWLKCAVFIVRQNLMYHFFIINLQLSKKSFLFLLTFVPSVTSNTLYLKIFTIP